ncbi:MAG: hypothetical protein KF802_14805 [Bdellovibrionaceae bacterium]|nr:hypothetical protein [Pseudobdellovibrionaceae bacterium]
MALLDGSTRIDGERILTNLKDALDVLNSARERSQHQREVAEGLRQLSALAGRLKNTVTAAEYQKIEAALYVLQDAIGEGVGAASDEYGRYR